MRVILWLYKGYYCYSLYRVERLSFSFSVKGVMASLIIASDVNASFLSRLCRRRFIVRHFTTLSIHKDEFVIMVEGSAHTLQATNLKQIT